MNDNSFVGIGHSPNPNVPDLPLGFGMRLMENAQARANFENLTNEKKTAVIDYIQHSTTGDDAKYRIAHSIENLQNGNYNFTA